MTGVRLDVLTSSVAVAGVPSERAGAATVQLFGGPCVVCEGRRIDVPEGSKRLLVLVALNAAQLDRRKAAGQLWPSGGDARAAGNLRSALWRLKGAGIDLVESDGTALRLRPGTVVDTEVASAWARRLVDGSAREADLDLGRWPRDGLDLLPGWYDDWVIFERERVRQRLLHGLEALGRRLSAARRHAEAVDAALTAVAADPLRDSAHRLLVEVHLAEGNLTEARRAYRLCCETFRRELGVEPSRELTQLVRAAEQTAALRPGALAR